MTWSVRTSAVRSWTTWTVKVCVVDLDGLGQDPDRRARDLRGADVPPRRGGGGDAGGIGQARWLRPSRPADHGAVRADDQGVGPGSAAAEDEPVARGVGGVGALATDQAHASVQLADAGALERPGHRRVERHGQDDQDEQGRSAAPQHEVATDVPDQPSVGGLGGQFRSGRLGRAGDPVRHPSLPRDDSPRRGRSRSADRRHRASRAGSGRRRPRRWA